MLDAEIIRAKAKRLGFSFIGFTGIAQTPHFPQFLSSLENVDFGDLEFLRKPYVISGRKDPSSLLEGGKSIIVLGVSYELTDKNTTKHFECEGLISAYALNEDYHHVIRTKTEEFVTSINEGLDKKIKSRIFIDSGPLMEKDLVLSAHIGWIGKHSIAIHPEFGSFFLICCILIDADCHEDKGIIGDLCGDCKICKQACPTGCIGNHSIDPTRCISYLTIEHKGIIPRDFRSLIGNRIFGCDICQIVCPYNKDLFPLKDTIFFGKERIIAPIVNLIDEMGLMAEDFKNKYKNTPVSRLSFIRYIRNIIVAAGNCQNELCVPGLSKYLHHPSEILRIHAAWALGNFRTMRVKNILEDRLSIEANPSVTEEIESALQ